MLVEQINDGNFQEKVMEYSKNTPVLVDFWAEWCGPCKAIAPMLDNIASEMGDKISIKKINIDENPQAPANFSIRSIPTMILFKDGSIADTKIGLGSESDLKNWISSKI
jgi:thioredoxin 1